MTSEPIVVGYDDSPDSRQSLGWALRTAQGRAAKVLLVRAARPLPLNLVGRGTDVASPHESSIEVGQATLDAGVRLAASIAPEVTVTTLLLKDSPAAELLSVLDKADMVVVGARGAGGFGLLVVGSTSLKLANHAPCPVVVVRAQAAHPEPGPGAGRVVVGVEGSEPASWDALAFAFEEAAWRRTGLTALHAWQEQPYGLAGKVGPIPKFAHGPEIQSEYRRLSECVSVWRERHPQVDVRHVVLGQDPPAALLAASKGAELVVVGSHARGGRHSLLPGSVSHALLHEAQCPVVVVGCHSTEVGTPVNRSPGMPSAFATGDSCAPGKQRVSPSPASGRRVAARSAVPVRP
jgi:nucleotide-binding universal stress UspA family protein